MRFRKMGKSYNALILMTVVFVLLMRTDAFECGGASTNNNIVFRQQWTVVNCDTSQLFAVAIGHSGDSYFHGNCIISGNTAATTARVKPDGTNPFTTGFPGSAIIRSFALRQDEGEIHFLVSGSGHFEFLSITTNDASLIRRLLLTTIGNTSSPYCLLLINPLNNMVFIAAQDSLNQAEFCTWSASAPNVSCDIISGVENARSLTYLNQNEIFYASIEQTGSNLSTHLIQWTRKYICIGGSGCTMGFSAATIDYSGTYIFVFNSYAQVGLEYQNLPLTLYLKFTILTASTGIPVISVYSFLITCPNIYKMEVKDSKVYAVANCITKTFFILYDINQVSFEFKVGSVIPTINLYGFAFESNSDRIVGVGVNGALCYLMKTASLGIEIHPDFFE